MATKKESDHMNSVASLGCIACQIIDIPDSPACIHHVREHSGRRDHFKTLPLCPPHHQTGEGGVTALHKNKKAFENEFGTQEELLEMVDKLLSNQSIHKMLEDEPLYL
jgi:acyl-CoA synthetase (AMP-forming)/AMP-acid ligase II